MGPMLGVRAVLRRSFTHRAARSFSMQTSVALCTPTLATPPLPQIAKAPTF